jgi:protein N-terminal amidase
LVTQNPKDFVAPFEAYEFGKHCKRKRVDLVLCAMNWLASEPPLDSPNAPINAWDEVKHTILYWFMRLTPLFGTNTIFAGCNRVGTERGTTFTGSSCVLKLSEPPSVLAYASKTEEKLFITEVDIP